MRFEWDEAKNEANIRNHKIDFADVPPIFNGPILLELDERENYGEDRWIGIGLLSDIPVVIVFTERQGDTIRIISARKADRHERRKFRETIAH